MNSYYIFLDIDGTLIDYNNYLPDSAVKAIHQAQKNGHKVFALTGRSKAEMYDHILAIGFDGYIGGNGSYIEYNEEVVKEKTLTLQECTRIVDWLYANGLEFYLESNEGLFASKNFEEAAHKPIQLYSANKGNDQADQLTVKDAFPEMIFGENGYRENVNKISFVLNSYDNYLKAKKEFNNYQVGTWGGVDEQALFGDIALANINKGTAVDDLLEYIDDETIKTIAFGDATVDIPMLERCDIGVAMGNGGKGIKEMADYITDSVEDDGLYNAFKQFNLI